MKFRIEKPTASGWEPIDPFTYQAALCMGVIAMPGKLKGADFEHVRHAISEVARNPEQGPRLTPGAHFRVSVFAETSEGV